MQRTIVGLAIPFSKRKAALASTCASEGGTPSRRPSYRKEDGRSMTTTVNTTAPLDAPASETDPHFQEIAANQWRVLDTRLPQGDVASLLSFVRASPMFMK